LKIPQLVLSLIGLAAIALAYETGKLEFLIIALAAFVGGLYYMGALGRKNGTEQTEKKNDAKNKSRNQPSS
jgi:hypothetical protein